MKKILSSVVLLGLLFCPVLAQDTKNVPISLNILGGMYVSIEPGTAIWPAISLPEDSIDEFIPSDEAIQDFFMSYSLASGHKVKLICESDTDLIGASTFPIDGFVRHTFSGEIAFSDFVPPADGVTQQEIVITGGAGGKKSAGLLFEFKNQTFPIGTYTASITYTMLDVII